MKFALIVLLTKAQLLQRHIFGWALTPTQSPTEVNESLHGCNGKSIGDPFYRTVD